MLSLFLLNSFLSVCYYSASFSDCNFSQISDNIGKYGGGIGRIPSMVEEIKRKKNILNRGKGKVQ